MLNWYTYLARSKLVYGNPNGTNSYDTHIIMRTNCTVFLSSHDNFRHYCKICKANFAVRPCLLTSQQIATYQNGNLKIMIYFAKFLGYDTNFYEAHKKEQLLSFWIREQKIHKTILTKDGLELGMIICNG